MLEKIYTAFDRIPVSIKSTFDGYDNDTYREIKKVMVKLKKLASFDTLLSPVKTRNSTVCSPLNGELDNLHLGYSKNKINNYSPMKTSTPDIENFIESPAPSKSIYSEMMAKKSLSFDVFSSASEVSRHFDSSIQSNTDLNSSDNGNKSKGKFVFKRPSIAQANNTTSINDVPSNTIDRIKTATERLKPLASPEAPKYVPLNNSSVAFQPPQSASSVFNNRNPTPDLFDDNFSKDNSSEEIDDYADYEIPINIEEEADLHVASTSKCSVINISDSIASTSAFESDKNKVINIDDDGWPEYRVEDFEDDNNEPGDHSKQEEFNEPEELNLMEHTILQEKVGNKYEGMGDFHTGTKNDGITGTYCNGCNQVHITIQ